MSQTIAHEQPSSTKYLNGHLGHLSTDQSQALEHFKSICAEDGCYIPSTSSSVKASHEDETLLRILRARKFVPQDAFQQFKASERWRKEQDLEDLYNTIDVHGYEETRVLVCHSCEIFVTYEQTDNSPVYPLDGTSRQERHTTLCLCNQRSGLEENVGIRRINCLRQKKWEAVSKASPTLRNLRAPHRLCDAVVLVSSV